MPRWYGREIAWGSYTVQGRVLLQRAPPSSIQIREGAHMRTMHYYDIISFLHSLTKCTASVKSHQLCIGSTQGLKLRFVTTLASCRSSYPLPRFPVFIALFARTSIEYKRSRNFRILRRLPATGYYSRDEILVLTYHHMLP